SLYAPSASRHSATAAPEPSALSLHAALPISMRPMLSLLAVPVALAALSYAAPSHAAEGDDRFALRLGAMQIDSDNTIRGNTNIRSEEHTSELQSREKLVCRLLLEKKNNAFAI